MEKVIINNMLVQPASNMRISDMKTYAGELKKGMMCRCRARIGFDYDFYQWRDGCPTPLEVLIFNRETGEGEWQLYEPKPKKVWGVPKKWQDFYIVAHGLPAGEYVVQGCSNRTGVLSPIYLCKDTAEQVVKARNVMNEYRMISDVPAHGREQYFINVDGEICFRSSNKNKLKESMFGVVVDSGREHNLEPWREKVRIANKIIQFGFHGIVEERL